MTWDGVVRLAGETLQVLAARHGGQVLAGGEEAPRRLRPIDQAQRGDLAPLLSGRFVRAAREAIARGAALLVEARLAPSVREAPAAWSHEHAAWALAELLETAVVPAMQAVFGEHCSIAPNAVLGPRVILGERVRIGAGTVVGHPGFGWAFGAGGAIRAVPQLGGVVIGDDVSIGPLCTVDAGTLAPTRIGDGVKLDAHVHVGHNVEIGRGTIIAAQCGLAGSVKIGAGVVMGGQVGIADHVVVGDGARIAGKSGVTRDVRAGAIVAGYPAVPRARWLRALAELYARKATAGDA